MHAWLSVNKLLCQLSMRLETSFDVMLSQIRVMNEQKTEGSLGWEWGYEDSNS